jgi:hypothetical protein
MNTTDERNNETTTNESTGFVWSARVSVAMGFILAVALAAAKFAPMLAAPLEWQH